MRQVASTVIKQWFTFYDKKRSDMCSGAGDFFKTLSGFSLLESIFAPKTPKLELPTVPKEPARANKEKADASIAKSIAASRSAGKGVSKSPTLLSSGGAGGIKDSALNLGGKSLIGG